MDMVSWICPDCACECAPTDYECPDCADLVHAGLLALANTVQTEHDSLPAPPPVQGLAQPPAVESRPPGPLPVLPVAVEAEPQPIVGVFVPTSRALAEPETWTAHTAEPIAEAPAIASAEHVPGVATEQVANEPEVVTGQLVDEPATLVAEPAAEIEAEPVAIEQEVAAHPVAADPIVDEPEALIAEPASEAPQPIDIEPEMAAAPVEESASEVEPEPLALSQEIAALPAVHEPAAENVESSAEAAIEPEIMTSPVEQEPAYIAGRPPQTLDVRPESVEVVEAPPVEAAAAVEPAPAERSEE